MPDDVYTPDTDFLSSQGTIESYQDLSELQVSDKDNSLDTQDDLTYEREEATRDTHGNVSYANSPVQMQFGEEIGLQYPCIYIKAAQANLEKHRLMALQNLVKSNNAVSRLYLYLDVDGSLMKLGSIDNKSLKTLLSNRLFSIWDISIKADNSTEYTGDMRLAYCAI